MSSNFSVPEKMFEVQVLKCNVTSGVVLEKITLHIIADTSTEAFARTSIYCADWTRTYSDVIFFPKSVKLAD